MWTSYQIKLNDSLLLKADIEIDDAIIAGSVFFGSFLYIFLKKYNNVAHIIKSGFVKVNPQQTSIFIQPFSYVSRLCTVRTSHFSTERDASC